MFSIAALFLATDLLMRQASGTSMNPEAAPMAMEMTMHGEWMLMLHGQAFLDYTEQSGPRGGDKVFSTNWIMPMAEHPLAGGQLMFRSMLSLEPATIGKKYPELFQTGETIHGQPIVDAQHPHDFFMELAAEYAHPIDANTTAYVYVAPVGDPALGPVAYPHRASASEIPQATLAHHLQDSTHIAANVITIGAQRGMAGYAISGFHGREPDEHRWDIDTGAIDSWSARVTFDPSPNWSAQVSTGHLKSPESAEPDRDAQRTTASVAYSNDSWNSSLIFGRNRNLNSVTAESVWRVASRNFITGRAEVVDKDELFVNGRNVYRIKALTAGYTRDVFPNVGVGGNVTLYSIPDALSADYGSRPRSYYLFVRVR